jgi:hypothetical protein
LAEPDVQRDPEIGQAPGPGGWLGGVAATASQFAAMASSRSAREALPAVRSMASAWRTGLTALIPVVTSVTSAVTRAEGTVCGTLASADGGGILRLTIAGEHEPVAIPLMAVTNLAVASSCP